MHSYWYIASYISVLRSYSSMCQFYVPARSRVWNLSLTHRWW